MKFLNLFSFLTAGAVVLSATSASAQFFVDGFDDISNWTEARDTDTTLAVVDYSADSIPEAPNMVSGSASTTGVKITANTLGSAAKANLIGAVTGGNADLALTTYQMQFDVWMNTTDPLPSGSTEQVLWGVGRTTSTPIGRPNRTTDGDGAWGWLAVENGYGSEDTVLRNDVNFVDSRSDGASPGHYNETFDSTVSDSVNDAPANQWVTITMTVDNGDVDVYYNSRLFLSGTGMSTVGDVMVGYEDPFGSIGSAPNDQFAIIDNVIIDDGITIVPVIPEPTSIALLCLGGLAMLARRRK